MVPALGLAGFTATGPAALSAAAGWQASIGVVEAGSLFAWCQSVAMGGTAVGGIQAAGVAGIGTTIASMADYSALLARFKKGFRTAERDRPVQEQKNSVPSAKEDGEKEQKSTESNL